MSSIEQILSFIIEVEKLKAVCRKTRPVGLARYENSAEHSWHVCLSALMLKDYANQEVDIDRVIKMLLIHDICEIDAGDTIVFNSDNQEIKDKEEAGLKRVLGLLPEGESEVYMALWYEFEAGQTTDAKYANAIDRLPPLLQNLHGDKTSWEEHEISKEKVISVNSRIQNGSKELWQVLEKRLDEAILSGKLK